MDKFGFQGNMRFTVVWILFFVPSIIFQWWLVYTVFRTTILYFSTQPQVVFWIAMASFTGYFVALFIRNIFRGV